jgi:hypothetical protein
VCDAPVPPTLAEDRSAAFPGTVYCDDVSAWVTESRQGRLNYKKESSRHFNFLFFFFALRTHTHAQKCEFS